MTMPQLRTGHAVPRHLDVEDFRTAAAQELAEATPWVPGICFLPECGAAFNPTRDWQIYCCADCERRGTAELRKWGHRLALAALAWRMGKNHPKDPAVKRLAAAGRRHVNTVQSAWLADRKARAERKGQE